MRRRWQYVVVGLVLVSALSVGITEAHRWSETGPEGTDAPTDREPTDCDGGVVEATPYDGDPPETTSYENLTDGQRRSFDAARTAANGQTNVTVNASLNISEVDYVVYENQTYFVQQYIVDCPWNDGSGGDGGGGGDTLETVLVPFFFIDYLVRILWLPVGVVVGLYVGYRKWTEWIQFG
jgi:hypothetical protein